MIQDNNLIYINYFHDLVNKGQHDYEKVGWGSSDSMHAKFCVLFHIIDWKTIQNVCDVGCGTGAFENLFSIYYPNVKFIGIDPLQEYLKISRSKNIDNAFFCDGNINNIPFENDKFDLVVNIGVLQNFDGDINHAISELCRITKKYLYIVALDEEYFGFKNGTKQKNQVNLYLSPSELSTSLKNNGFQIIDCKSISVDSIEEMIKSKEFIKPIHETHTFFILAKKENK